MSQIQWTTSKKSRWHISDTACKFAYHYCLACSEDGAPERWRQRVCEAVSEAVPEPLAGYLLRYLTVEGTTVEDLIRDGLPEMAAPIIREGRRCVFYQIAKL